MLSSTAIILLYVSQALLDPPFVSLADSLIRVGGELRVPLVDAVVGEVDEAIGEGLHGGGVPIQKGELEICHDI